MDRPEAAEVPTDRRPVTVLFADLVGFSTLAEHLDPEELRGLMTETFAELTKEIESREGTVEKFIGDAVMAVFGAPQAHEDDPFRAVDAAVAMLEAVRLRSEGAPAPVSLRVGINSGLVVSGTVGDGSQTGVMGDAVNVAARLQQAADPGEVVVSEAVWRRVRDAFDGQRVGALEVKGREQAVEAHRISARREATSRRQAPFVGRRDELALLELLWSAAERGTTHVVSLIGEPGVGKSRLLSEFPAREGAMDVRVTCGAERAFGPFLELIGHILGRIPTDPEDLRRLVADAGVDEETSRLLAVFLGLGDAPPVTHMADEQKRRQVFAGVWQFLLAARGDRPALIVLDDVHWADLSSLDLLGFLLERLSGVPAMLILAYRPGFERVERATLRAGHTGIRLEPLTARESAALARGFLGVADLPANLERIVTDRAEGNPFFVEELLQALLELGSLAVVDGRAVLAKVEVDIPDTVQGTILARIDRLAPAERSLLQQAAVIGRTFSADLLGVSGNGAGVGPLLEQLGRAQLVVPHGPAEWTFKHALIQEVAYETLLHRQRRELHRKVAEALEVRAGDDPALLELLAEHYARAEVPEKAREYAVRAGDVAAQRMGLIEAKGRYETALRLWGQGDDAGRLALLMKLGQAALTGGDPSAARAAFVEAAEGWQVVGQVRNAGAALATLGRVLWVTGEIDRAADTLQRAIDVLEPEGSTPELVQAFVWRSTQLMLDAQTDQSAPIAQRGLRMAEELGLDGARSHLLNNLGVCEGYAGNAAGIDRLREALDLAQRVGDAEAIGRAYINLPETLESYGQYEEGIELNRRAREDLRRMGALAYETFVAGNEARGLAMVGRYEEAEALGREALAHERAMRTPPGIVNATGGLILALIRRGRLEEARALRDEVAPLARRVGGADFLGRFLMWEAELEEALGNRAAARQVTEEVLELVFSRPGVLHRAQALPSVARLLPGERVEALVNEVRSQVRHPALEAPLREAEAKLTGDRVAFRRAADLYSGLGMPYEEARCRLEAGDLDRARELIERFELAKGWLGARLRELST
jgi:adenylate cyclase